MGNAHQRWFEWAEPLGKNLNLIGHSIRGLISFRAALLNPEKIKAAVHLSPALESNLALKRKIYFGDLFNLDFDKNRKWLRFFYRTEKPARAGFYVSQLIRSVFSPMNSNKLFDRNGTYKLYHVLSLILSTENDNVVSHHEIKNFYYQTPDLKEKIFLSKRLWSIT